MDLNKETSQTVDRAIAVLELFADAEELGISEISRRMSLGKATTARLVSSLERGNLLSQNKVTKKYRLGMQLLFLGTLVQERDELSMQMLPCMTRLGTKYKVSVNLIILEGFQARILRKYDAVALVNITARTGSVIPAYCMASGKLLLALGDAAQQEDFFSQAELTAMTEKTIVDKAMLREEFARIRRRGYAEDDQESCIGLSCIAVPLCTPSGQVLAALSLSGQTQTVSAHRAEMLEDLLQESRQFRTR